MPPMQFTQHVKKGFQVNIQHKDGFGIKLPIKVDMSLSKEKTKETLFRTHDFLLRFVEIMRKVNEEKPANDCELPAFVLVMGNVLGYVNEFMLACASHANEHLLHHSAVPKMSI